MIIFTYYSFHSLALGTFLKHMGSPNKTDIEPTQGNADNRINQFFPVNKPAKITGISIDTLDWVTLSKGGTSVAKRLDTLG